MSTFLLGLGVSVPEGRLATTAAADHAAACCCTTERQRRVLRELHRRTTIETRGICLADDGVPALEALHRFYPPRAGTTRSLAPVRSGPTTGQRMDRFRQLAPGLALPACTRALEDARLAPRDVTHLITITCTGFAAPGLEAAIMGGLRLDRTIGRIAIGFMGCHAALNGLQTAAAIVRAEPRSRVLVCSAELCSLHFQYGWHPQRIVANALFADGAAAAVLGATAPRDGRRPWCLVASASRLIDDTADAMSWHIGDHGFVMTLSPRVPAAVATNIRPWLDDWLAEHGLDVASVGSWAIHAGGPRIVQAVVDRLEIDAARVVDSRRVLREHGNMSSATVLFIIERLRRREAPMPCVALSFGPGLVAEAVLLDDDPGGCSGATRGGAARR